MSRCAYARRGRWRLRLLGVVLLGPLRSQCTAPDTHWYSAWPQLLVKHRGPEGEAMIDALQAAVARYAWRGSYRLWPGPNSNTFVARLAREVPQLRLDLPSTAIGKDWLGPTTIFGSPPSGTGWQLSVLGLG